MSTPRPVAEELAALWARYLESPKPRAWLGPFGGRVLRGCRPVERLRLEGSPLEPRLRQWRDGRWRPRDVDPLELVEERARSLGLRGLGYVAYEYAHLLEDFPVSPAPSSTWPLLAFDFHREQEDLRTPLRGSRAWPSQHGGSEGNTPGLAPEQPAERFHRGVRRIRDWIRAGDCYQVNLVQGFGAAWETREAARLFAALRAADAGVTGYRALLEESGRAVVCDSPELFLERRGDRLSGQPIKGTARLAPLGSRRAALAEARERLLASDKDRAELAMIVDLLRNDLSRVCRPGSVRVGRLPEWVRLPSLLHSSATVRGRLRPGLGLAAVFQAAFPCGSITGCPRLRAMERIAQLEPGPRGPCFGALGLVETSGDFLFNVAIRTALLEGGRLRLLAGGGITIDSTPQAEEAESRWKTEQFRRALRQLG